MNLSSLNLPNILTLLRLVLSPLLLPICLVNYLPYNNFFVNILLALLFLVLSLTDFLDGYIARKYNLETEFGRAIDPIADKFLVISTLISLLAVNKIFFFWVIILIGRELFMMGLRQIALENKFSIKVSVYGKIKTVFQVIMLTLIILNPSQGLALSSLWNISEGILIFITISLSLFSAVQYFLSFKKQLN